MEGDKTSLYLHFNNGFTLDHSAIIGITRYNYHMDPRKGNLKSVWGGWEYGGFNIPID